MFRSLRRGFRAAAFGLVLAGLIASPVFAADPKPTSSAGAPFTGTGIEIDPEAPPVDDGIPAGYADLKRAQLKTFLAGGKLPAPPKKTGAGAGATSRASAMLAAASCGAWPCADRIWWQGETFIGFHQQTRDWCLVAFVQSVAWYDLGTSYEYLGTSRLYDAQYKILNGYPTSSDSIRLSGSPGATDPKALRWINDRFLNAGHEFYYLTEKPSTLDRFENLVHFDISYEHEMMYVRVDLTDPGYGWQVAKDGLLHLHATAAVAYDDTAGNVTSYDPYSTRRPDGSCLKGYGGTSHWGCVWTLMPSRYFSAMDDKHTIGVTKPVWF